MEQELNALDSKVSQVTAALWAIRQENQELRGRVATLEDENRRLSQRMEEAARRLESLVDKVPE